MKKLNRKKIILLIFSIFIIIAILVYLCFIIFDLKVDDTYFAEKKIRKDFEIASKYLLTGDCTSFNNYIFKKTENDNLCEHYQPQKIESGWLTLKSFKLKDLSYNPKNGIAFLNIEVLLNVDYKDISVIEKAQMKKEGSKWKFSYLK